MRVIDNYNCLTVSDFVEDFMQDNSDALVLAIWHDEDGKFHESAIYKFETSADDNEVYLYLSNWRPSKVSEKLKVKSGG